MKTPPNSSGHWKLRFQQLIKTEEFFFLNEISQRPLDDFALVIGAYTGNFAEYGIDGPALYVCPSVSNRVAIYDIGCACAGSKSTTRYCATSFVSCNKYLPYKSSVTALLALSCFLCSCDTASRYDQGEPRRTRVRLG